MINFEKISVKSSDKELVNLSFDFNGSLAIVGESGSGKSLTLKAIMGVLPKELRGEVSLIGTKAMQRGKDLAFVPQNPFTALSPMSKIKKQFWPADSKTAIRLLEQTGLDAAYMDRFPSELSGGQLQRVIIAVALSQNPKLLLMDEPTTALDSETKEEMVLLIKDLMVKLGFYLIFVTHELGLAKKLCEKILVMGDGRTIEIGDSKDIFENPKTEYTKRLLEADFNGREFRK